MSREMQSTFPVASPSLTLSDGRTVVLLERIGRGTCGVVHRGVLESAWGIRRPVAIKTFDVTADLDHDETMRRLARIVRRAASVRHGAVVQVLEMDRADAPDGEPRPFVVTELVEGESLAGIVQGWRANGLRVPTDFALVVALRVAEGLGAALFSDTADGSISGLVHGDLSLRQVLVSSEGDVKITDFGQQAVSSLVSRVRSRTRLAYTAPEVACGGEPDARSDVFSLGVMLYELLIGPRFASGTEFSEAVQLVRDGRFHATLLEPNLPKGLRRIIEHALDRNPMQRYPHARVLAFDLRREMHRLGLSDAHTSVRHAVVGWCEVRSGETPSAVLRNSEVVPKLDDDVSSRASGGASRRSPPRP